MQLTFRSMRSGIALAIAALCLSTALEIADAGADPVAAPTSSAALASSRRAAKDECGKREKRRHRRKAVRKARARRERRKAVRRARRQGLPPPPMR